MSTNTAERILDLAQELIMRRGYNAFSYQDIAKALSIRTASIHYHYPNKATLGAAVIKRYREALCQAVTYEQNGEPGSAWSALKQFLAPFHQVSAAGDFICLCGSLAGEFGALSEEMQSEVRGFFEEQQKLLAEIFTYGQSIDEFEFSLPAGQLARFSYNALHGGLLIGRARQTPEHFQEIVETLFAQLKPA